MARWRKGSAGHQRHASPELWLRRGTKESRDRAMPGTRTGVLA
jgi:hypothetical protein